ncbi:MAG: hypothetical protein GX922_04730 [Firmicutes bacterium]|nr:hypothetical protein [Bacillota bacterium]
MNSYYYDEETAMVYKISPITATIVKDEEQKIPTAILVHSNIKVTNFKREKVRRTLSEVYPYDKFNLDAAKKTFTDTILSKLLGNAVAISEEEYNKIKERIEPVAYC